MRRSGRVVSSILVLMTFLAGQAQSSSKEKPAWQTALSESLASTYSLSKVAFFSNSITQAGTVVVVQKDGLSGAPWEGGIGDNLIRDGQIQQKGRNLYFGMESNRRSFKVGEKHYVRRVAVKDAEVQVSLVTLDTYDVIEDGKTKPSRFRAELHFQYPPGQLDTMTYAQVKAAIDAVVAREQDAVAARTVTLGQTREQVEAILGRPETVLDLGAKVVYAYRNLKVVFVDGKVSDVQ